MGKTVLMPLGILILFFFLFSVNAETTFFDNENDAFIMGNSQTAQTTDSVDTNEATVGGGCSYNWSCTNWTECFSDGRQTRTCFNTGTCSDKYKTPEVEKKCSYTASGFKESNGLKKKNTTEKGAFEQKVKEKDETKEKETRNKDWGVVYGLIGLLVLFILFYLDKDYFKALINKTKERYLIKEVLKGQEMIKESQKKAYGKLEKIQTSFQKEWKRCPESAKQKENEEIAIAFTYNTNAIEGSAITLEETREIVINKVRPDKPLKDVLETEAHFKIFLEMLDNPKKISKKLLLKWHKNLFGETKKDIAGRFRDFLVIIGNYRAPDWQDVEGLMKEFFKFLKKAKINPVELAARAHYKFEKIHPFGDGNGRIGRLIINQILWQNGYPMIIIEYAKRRSYYNALQRDEDGFANYFLRRYMTVHKKRY